MNNNEQMDATPPFAKTWNASLATGWFIEDKLFCFSDAFQLVAKDAVKKKVARIAKPWNPKAENTDNAMVKPIIEPIDVNFFSLTIVKQADMAIMKNMRYLIAI